MPSRTYDTLIRELEITASRNPDKYRLRVIALAVSGNLYIVAIMLLMTLLLAALALSVLILKALAIKLILIVGVVFWISLKAMWVRVPPPQGLELKRAQSPELFVIIDALRRDLGAPAFHHVLITGEFNAGVVQSPRFGLFGFTRNYLLIGLPLLKTMTPEQLKAVLAHEFGHLAKGHGSMSNWIYRQRIRWARLVESFNEGENDGGFLFRPFLNRFVPYFNAYSFPLARANEFEADATAARLTGSDRIAEALTSIHVIDSYLTQTYWPGIYSKADLQPQPSFAPYHGLSVGLDDLDRDALDAWLNQAMAQVTDMHDTHPSLRDRLQALQSRPMLAFPEADAAADRLLGPAQKEVTGYFDNRWQQDIRDSWQARYQKCQAQLQDLAELDRRAGSGSLSADEALERALLTESVGNQPEAALAQLKILQEDNPEHASIAMYLSARLLNRDDPQGVALAETAMRLDEDFTISACGLIRDYCLRADLNDQAQLWQYRLEARNQLQTAAAAERQRITLKDKFDQHGLTPEQMQRLKRQMQACRSVRKAYFVRKRVKNLNHRPLYILAFRVTAFYQLHRAAKVEKALREIRENVEFPGETAILNVDADNYRFGRKFFWMKGSRLQ